MKEAEIDFPSSILLNKKKLVSEVIPKYPNHESLILTFHKILKASIRVAMLVFMLSLVIGYYYVKNR